MPGEDVKSAVVDVCDMMANMYGCRPCPMCGDVYRCMFNDKPGIIQCQHCGYEEEAVIKEM